MILETLMGSIMIKYRLNKPQLVLRPPEYAETGRPCMVQLSGVKANARVWAIHFLYSSCNSLMVSEMEGDTCSVETIILLLDGE